MRTRGKRAASSVCRTLVWILQIKIKTYLEARCSLIGNSTLAVEVRLERSSWGRGRDLAAMPRKVCQCIGE